MRALTYLIYIVAFEGLILGGCGYAVFFLNRSGWWFALAIFIACCAYRPAEWIHGKVIKHDCYKEIQDADSKEQ